MKKIFFIGLLLSDLLFAEPVEVKPGYTYFGLDNITTRQTGATGTILEICPLGDVCRLTFDDGYILYVKKGQVYTRSTGYFTEVQYKVLSWDYNILYCDKTEIEN